MIIHNHGKHWAIFFPFLSSFLGVNCVWGGRFTSAGHWGLSQSVKSSWFQMVLKSLPVNLCTSQAWGTQTHNPHVFLLPRKAEYFMISLFFPPFPEVRKDLLWGCCWKIPSFSQDPFYHLLSFKAWIKDGPLQCFFYGLSRRSELASSSRLTGFRISKDLDWFLASPHEWPCWDYWSSQD
jgi:hypothetical protein